MRLQGLGQGALGGDTEVGGGLAVHSLAVPRVMREHHPVMSRAGLDQPQTDLPPPARLCQPFGAPWPPSL